MLADHVFDVCLLSGDSRDPLGVLLPHGDLVLKFLHCGWSLMGEILVPVQQPQHHHSDHEAEDGSATQVSSEHQEIDA